MSNNLMELLLTSLGETIYMVVVAILIACLIGIPLGIILTITRKDPPSVPSPSSSSWSPSSPSRASS